VSEWFKEHACPPKADPPPAEKVCLIKMCVVYVLRSEKDGQRYVGCTKDLEARLKKHHSGQVKSTKGRRPVVLVYKEDAADWSAARKREDFLKSGQGRQWLDEQGF
jgi:putative endonuclease